MSNNEPKPPRPSASTGRRGEDIAARYLVKHGCKILARNWRSNPGEIDIVADCPVSSVEGAHGISLRSITPLQERELAFIEVRTRHGRLGLAEESISSHKATNMLTAAYAYMVTHNIDPDVTPWRIDLMAIAMSGPTITGINWVKNAIDEDMLEG